LFLIATNRWGGFPYYCSYIALIFCHEVGVFSALLLAWLGFRSINEKNRLALAVHVALLAAPIVIFVAVIALGGSKGSTR
jgi:fumarate reductase subunit C